METIFTITTVDLRALPPYGGKTNHDPRCVGYFFNLDDAIKIVEGNYGDIHEYSFDYAVIEEFGEGLYPHPKSEHWFKFDKNKREYVSCDKPEKNVINYGIG